MPFTITPLVENTTASPCLAPEHGLSIFVEGNGKKILYDTGPSPRFLLNAKALSADLDDLDAIVLSHGHYDHTGGTTALLARGRGPKAVYVGKGFFKERYSRKGDDLLELSATVEARAISHEGIPCVEVGDEPMPLGPGVWLLSGFVSTDEQETANPNSVYRDHDQFKVDQFEDEVVLVLETGEGLAMISGCSHVGILSICRRVEEIFEQKVVCFIGGTHLMNAGDSRIAHTCRRLREMGIRRLGACHCNGERASAYFKENFPGYFENQTGTRVVLE